MTVDEYDEDDEYRFKELLLKKLTEINSTLRLIHKEIKNMSVELDALKTKVEETVGVQKSAVALLQGIVAQLTDLAAKLEAAGIDNTEVVALTDELTASTNELAIAVANNPTPPPAPVTPEAAYKARK
jgi:methyl-accepting chemotaxis protein